VAIVVVSRWKGSYEQALPILREASLIMKEAGATSVVAGVCHAGPETSLSLTLDEIMALPRDLIYAAVTYPDWATYGRLRENASFRRVYAEFLKVVEVHDRSFIVGEEL
jgi:hypothetical protein